LSFFKNSYMSNSLNVNVTGPTGIQSNGSNAISVALSGDSTSYLGVRTNQFGVTYDSFGRMRVSNPYTQFDNKSLYDAQTFSWNVSTSGTASSTYNASIPGVTLSAGTGVAVIVRRTKRRFLCRPGLSQLIYMSMTGAEPNGGAVLIWGYTDSTTTNFPCENGLYFSSTTSNFSVNIMSGGSTTSINQSAFNGDKMNGTGASGLTLNLTEINTFFINFAWMGSGEVMFGVKVNNELIVMHTYFNSNINPNSFIADCNLHLSYAIDNNSTLITSTMTLVAATIISEGDPDPFKQNAIYFSIDRDLTVFTSAATTSIYPLLTMQLNPSYLGAQIYITGISIVSTISLAYRWGILLNPTISGTLPSTTNQSSIQYTNTSTDSITVSGGTQLYSAFIGPFNTSNISANAQNIFGNTPVLGVSGANVSDVLVLFIQSPGAVASTFYASITYAEII
jgi:hypothetical protein